MIIGRSNFLFSVIASEARARQSFVKSVCSSRHSELVLELAAIFHRGSSLFEPKLELRIQPQIAASAIASPQ
jgi:hypothetical protein